MNDIIGKKWIYFAISTLVIVPGIISLFIWGIKPSIDFTGGTLVELQFSGDKKDKASEEIKKIAELNGIGVGSIQLSGNNTYLLRLKSIDKNQNDKLQEDIGKQIGAVKEVRFETVGPSIGKETEQNALKGILVASLAIVIYIALAFRGIPKPYSSVKFGLCAVLALIHDVLVVVGLFSIFGHFFHAEIDTLFITALLTVMGFSVHDTIVVFDRIRENLRRMPGKSFAHIVNESIIQTLARSLSTSLTVIFTLFALLLFGGESIKWFLIALLIGITSGTYSSIFNAAPLLVLWNELSEKRAK